jgi:molybdate transport system permease protein
MQNRRTIGALLLVWSFPLFLFLTLPLLALLLRVRADEFFESLQKQEVFTAIRLSIASAAISTALAIFFGTPLAYWLARYRFRGRGLINVLLDLPMVLPPAVAGIALLLTFGRRGLLGASFAQFGVTIAFTQMAVILAQLFVASPFYIKTAIAGFDDIDYELEQAASLDGANRWQIFRYITVPLIWPVLFSGAVMSWARALGEFGATIIFAGNFPGRTQTMPLAIYLGFELDLGAALTLSALLLLISFVVLFTVKRSLGWNV